MFNAVVEIIQNSQRTRTLGEVVMQDKNRNNEIEEQLLIQSVLSDWEKGIVHNDGGPQIHIERPLPEGFTEEDAQRIYQDWMERSRKGEGINVFIGRPHKFDDELQHFSFRIPRYKLELLDMKAKAQGVSRSDYVRYLIDKDLGFAVQDDQTAIQV